MARKKQQPTISGSVLFDVIYEDGVRTSNRKVPATEVSGFEGDTPAKTFIEAQDRKIVEMGGGARGRIKSIIRSPGQ